MKKIQFTILLSIGIIGSSIILPNIVKADTLGYTSIGTLDCSSLSGGLGSIGTYVTAPIDASVTDIQFYLSSSDTSDQLNVGLYSGESSSTPGSLLVQSGIVSSTQPGWNIVPISYSLTAGTSYWILGTDNMTAPIGCVYDIVSNPIYYALTTFPNLTGGSYESNNFYSPSIFLDYSTSTPPTPPTPSSTPEQTQNSINIGTQILADINIGIIIGILTSIAIVVMRGHF